MAKVDKKAKKIELEKDAAALFEQQGKIIKLEQKLQENPDFKKYLKLQNSFKTQDALFRESVKNEMIKFDIQKIAGDWGSIALVTREDYKVIDEDKVPNEYKEEKTIIQVDTKSIKDDFTLTGVLPAGIEIKKSQYIRITEKKEK